MRSSPSTDASIGRLDALYERDPEFDGQIAEALEGYGIAAPVERRAEALAVHNAWQFKPAARRASNELTWFQSWLVHPSRKRNVVAVAARRSGKTVGARLLCILAGLDPGPGDIGYMAPTLGQAKRLLWRPLMQDLRDPASRPFIVGKPNNSELTIEFVTGTRLYLFSAEAPERVRGEGFKLFITDETDDPLFTEDIFDEAIGPALSDNQGRLVQLGTPKGRGRLYKEWRKGQLGDFRRVDYDSLVVTAVDAGIIPLAEILDAKSKRPKRAFQQEYEANFNTPIGIVYDEWNEAVHVVGRDRIPTRFDEIIVGVDWGEATRGGMLVIGIDRVARAREDGELPRVWILEEHTHKMMKYTDDGWWKIARQIQAKWAPKAWYCDPAQTLAKYLDNLRGVLRRACEGTTMQTSVFAADNKVRPGISAIQELLHYNSSFNEEPHLFVYEKCEMTRKEFGSYRFRSVKGVDDTFIEEVVKEEDHLIDCARYATYTRLFSRSHATRTIAGQAA